MAKLIVRGGDGSEREVTLDETGSVSIGRSPECDIPIDEGQASRRHCTVVAVQSGFEVSDLGSTNGTTVNGTLIKKQHLNHGDVIRIGACEIRFSDPNASPVSAGSHCTLVYARGDRKGEKIELREQRTTIGRKANNTITIEDVVASSNHCEIVRGLNGYTIRDLGSTNGTLVNNEMMTEAQLTHGARIRVGNTRFVFQDPTMAEIDLELAGADEDDEWGMMRDLDLAAVRKRNPATLVYGVLFLGILGALGFLLTREPGKRDVGPVSPANNRHEPYSFETAATALSWDSQPAGAVNLSVTTKTKASGKSALELRGTVDGAQAFYATTLQGRNQRYKVTAKAKGSSARLGLLWRGLGLERWVSVPLGGGMGAVTLVSSAPPWARSVQLGVVFDKPGTAVIDDLVMLAQGGSSAVTEAENEFEFTVTDGRSLDVKHAGRPILAHGLPVAFDAAGRPVEADLTLSVSTADKEHSLLKIDGAGDAATVGVVFEAVAGYLTRGGFRAFGDAESGTYYRGSFPDESRLDQNVRKLLVGPSGAAFAVVGADDSARFESLARADGRARIWTIRVPARVGAIRLKHDLRGESTQAQEALQKAQSLYSEKRYGEFLDSANRALAEFPFASRVLRDRLRDRVTEVNKEYGELIKDADAGITDYDEFKDIKSLDDVSSILDTLRTRFQVVPGEGPRGEKVARLAKAAQSRLGKALSKRHNKHANSFVDQAEFIHMPEKEIYSAGLLYFNVSTFLGDSDKAAAARKALEEIDKNNPDLLRALRKLGIGKQGD